MLESAVEAVFAQRVRNLGGLSFKFAPIRYSRGMILTYDTVHSRLVEAFGPARNQTCSCGKPARDWAYQHTAEEEFCNIQGHPYTTDLSHYRAMCRSCHTSLDAQSRPEKPHPIMVLRSDQGRNRESSRQNMLNLARRRRGDPDLDRRLSEVSRVNGKVAQAKHLERMEEDPEYAERMRQHALANLKRGNQVISERRESDPEFDRKMSEMHREEGRKMGLKSSKIRRGCMGCDLVSNPGGVALHQKRSGHHGYRDA